VTVVTVAPETPKVKENLAQWWIVNARTNVGVPFRWVLQFDGWGAAQSRGRAGG
jgi:hypothetical protein